jgi:two-component system phosphate regulon response regulator PhoB
MAVVLIVDDDEALCGLVSATLAVAGIDSRTALTGAEALTLVSTTMPDCIVLDITLPDASGLDLCATWRADNRTEGIPVLLLTARSQHDDRAIGFDSGADDYIVKPFDPEDLSRRITALLSSVRQQRWHRDDSTQPHPATTSPTLTLGGGPVPR